MPVVTRHELEDLGQRAGAERLMGWNRNTLMSRRLGFEDDMAAGLVNSPVVPVLHKMFRKIDAVEIPRQLHATAITSSRTRCSRMDDGGVESK